MTNVIAIIMEKSEIMAILEDWNFWKKELDTGIERTSYLEALKSLSKTDQAVAVMGARRSGKSYIMRQFAKYLIQMGVEKSGILMVNFDDSRFVDLDVRSLQEIYETYLEFLAPAKGERPYVFLDEVHEVTGWEKWVRTMHELGKAKIMVSGSNSRLLGTELATLLTGRHIDMTVFPLSFAEFLTFKDAGIKDELDAIAKRTELKRWLREYLEFGAFPVVVLSESGDAKKELLLKYFEDVLDKDIVKRFRIKKSGKLKALAKFYLTNVAAQTTYNSLEKHLDLSSDTIEKFSDYFETSYLVFFLKRFSFKVREQEKSPRKVYAIDTGLANTIGFRFTENLGRMAENVVFLELKRRKNAEVFYWKDAQHHEVDFVVKTGGKMELIQVCWNPENIETRKRETRALANAMEELKLKHGTIITEDYEKSEEKIGDGKTTIYIPLWKWLLLSDDKPPRQ